MKHVNQTNHIQPSSDVAVVVAEDEANGDDERLVAVVIVVVVIEAATIQKLQDLYISHEVEEVTRRFLINSLSVMLRRSAGTTMILGTRRRGTL